MSILELARRAGDIPANEVAPGILIFGPSGNGKTYTAATGGKPLIILLERNGLSAARRANPNAHVIVIGYGPDQKPIAGGPEAHLNQVRAIVQAAMNGELKAHGYDRLVIDSLTELQRLFSDAIRAEASKKKESKASDDGPQEEGDEDGGMSLRMWGFLSDRMQQFLRTIRSLPIPVVCTALVEDLKDLTPSSVRPLFQGKKTAGQVAQFFSAVGFAARRNHEVEAGDDRPKLTVTEFRTLFDGPARYAVKSCGPVTGSLMPDPTAWIAAISEINGPDATIGADGHLTEKKKTLKKSEPEKPAEA